jgi:hypothetical protein
MKNSGSSNDSFQDLIAQAHFAIQESGEILSRFELARRKHLEGLVGMSIEDFLQSRTAAFGYLNHSEAKHRIAALSILATYTDTDDQFAAICEQMMAADPDNEVREVALIAYCKCYISSKNLIAGRLLANILLDESKAAKLRSAAYFGLLRVAGVPVEHWPDLVSFRLPEDVDWSLVNPYLMGGGAGRNGSI